MRTPFKLLTIPCFCDWFEESNNYSLQNKSEVICLLLQSKNMEQYPQPILNTTILITTIHEYINSINLCSKNLLIYKRAFFKTTKPNVKKLLINFTYNKHISNNKKHTLNRTQRAVSLKNQQHCIKNVNFESIWKSTKKKSFTKNEKSLYEKYLQFCLKNVQTEVSMIEDITRHARLKKESFGWKEKTPEGRIGPGNQPDQRKQ
jgi:hypothetical protein